MPAFLHSAVGFGTPDMPPPAVGSSLGPISLHNAIVVHHGEAIGVGVLGDQFAVLVHLYGGLGMVRARGSADRETRVRGDVLLVG